MVTFDNNEATLPYGQGGAVHVAGNKSPVFVSCTFKGNTAGVEGGAICNAGNNGRTVEVYGSAFDQNTPSDVLTKAK